MTSGTSQASCHLEYNNTVRDSDHHNHPHEAHHLHPTTSLTLNRHPKPHHRFNIRPPSPILTRLDKMQSIFRPVLPLAQRPKAARCLMSTVAHSPASLG